MKIPPLYKITPEIISLISKIEAKINEINGLEIPDELKNKIKRISLLKSSLFSARIEGNTLNMDEVDHTPDQKKKLEVFNIIKASGLIDQEIKNGDKITEKTILGLHKKVMENIGVLGFRHEPTAIFNQAEVVVYLPPPPSQLLSLIDDLLNYINKGKEKFPILKALIAHLIFEKIHPFIDGNGRVGRLLIFAILKANGFNSGFTIPFEKYLDEHKNDYYYFLDCGMQKTEDYLVFMLRAILDEAINLISQIKLETAKDKNIYLLPPRQEEMYNIIKDHLFVSFDNLRRRFLEVPERTLRYDLKKLQDNNLIVKIGKTRGSFYKIGK